MARIFLMILGAAILSTPVFSGEYLTNDTGAVVVGLRVAFSEPVTITAFGDVLTNVEPDRQATEFIFSGGTLGAWEGLWFNWAPASATLTEREWLTALPSDSSGAGWQRMFGPPGGYVETLAISPSNPLVIYGTGSDEGIYKTINGGLQWSLIPFVEPTNTAVLLVDPSDSELIYSGHNGLSRSYNGGLTWENIASEFRDTYHVRRLCFAPDDSTTLYLVARRHDQSGIAILKSVDRGDSWTSAGTAPDVPRGSDATAFSVQSGGVLMLGINDYGFREWQSGQLFISGDSGAHWKNVDYGRSEPRFIWSVFANPWFPQELWVTEGPLHNTAIDQPIMYRSEDLGTTWNPVFFAYGGYDSSQVRVIGASSSGSVYVAAGSSLYVTDDDGGSFRSITPPQDLMMGVDFFDIEVDPIKPETLYLPLRCSGIAYSEDNGETWMRRDQGISSISPNIVEADPFYPEVVYASSSGGQGVFRSDDYGLTWSQSLVGIAHPFGDEIDPDPHHEGTIWFVADVPYIHKSIDFGDSWTVIANPREAGGFNFCSVYAIAQGNSTDRIYVVDNGFGIFRGTNGYASGNWNWWFLRDSDVDYSYTLAVEPDNDQIIYSGFSRKPFQDSAMVRASYDGGNSWFTSLQIDDADAITSLSLDPKSPANVYAGATSVEGGSIWSSDDRGATWVQPNPRFTFTTIHSYAVAPSDPMCALVGVWGGGTYRTTDAGATWHKLEDPVTFSAAGIAVDPTNADHIYIADRSSPRLYVSTNGGLMFETLFDAGSNYSRLMGVTADPSDPACLYVTAMRTIGPGTSFGSEGSLFRVISGEAEDITGGLPRLPLSMTVSPTDSNTLYAILHGYGVYRSRDRGSSWTDVSSDGSGLPHCGFFSLVVDPTDADTLYLVGGCDVQFQTFKSSGLDPYDVNTIYRSQNSGNTWERLGGSVFGRDSGAIKALAFYGKLADTMLAAAENGMFISLDHGETWRQDHSLPYDTLGGVAVAENSILAMTNGGGVLRGTISVSGQVLWEDEACVTAQVFFAQVINHPTETNTLFSSGYPGGVFKSIDRGVTWHETNFGLPSFSVDDPLRQGYYALAISSSHPNVLYLGLYGKGVYKSTNGAVTWKPTNGSQWEMAGRKITSLAVHPTNGDRVVVSTEDGVFQSNDGGASWHSAQTGLPTSDVKLVYFAPNGALYAGTRGYGFFTWKNNRQWEAQSPVGQWGVIWPIWDDRPRYQYTDVLFHPSNPDKILIGTFPAGIYSSEDGGETWSESNIGWTLDGVFCLISHPEQPDVVFAGTYNGVNLSLDFGEHWEMWDNGWPDEQWVFTIAFDPEDPNIMYACSKNGENEGAGRPDFHGTVMKSLDGGQEWFPIVDGLALDQEFYDLIVDPVDGNTLYLASQRDGMYISRDAGALWESWNEGLKGTEWFPWNEGLQGIVPATNGNNVTRMLALSGDYRYIYFGSFEAGIFRREIHLPEGS